jgi:hypothetical protein
MRNYFILFLIFLMGLDAIAQQGYNEMATPKLKKENGEKLLMWKN